MVCFCFDTSYFCRDGILQTASVMNRLFSKDGYTFNKASYILLEWNQALIWIPGRQREPCSLGLGAQPGPGSRAELHTDPSCHFPAWAHRDLNENNAPCARELFLSSVRPFSMSHQLTAFSNSLCPMPSEASGPNIPFLGQELDHTLRSVG